MELIIKRAFAAIDDDGSGSVTATEFQEAMRRMGEDLDYEDVAAIIQEADRDGDGHIDLEEFAALMKTVVSQV